MRVTNHNGAGRRPQMPGNTLLFSCRAPSNSLGLIPSASRMVAAFCRVSTSSLRVAAVIAMAEGRAVDAAGPDFENVDQREADRTPYHGRCAAAVAIEPAR